MIFPNISAFIELLPGTHRAVCPVKDPAGEVGGVAHHPRHVLGQLGVKVGATRPQPEPGAGSLLLHDLCCLLLGSVVDVAHSVVT